MTRSVPIHVWVQPNADAEDKNPVRWTLDNPAGIATLAPTPARAVSAALKAIGEGPATIHWHGRNNPW